MYKIEKITYKDGSEKLDDKSIIRKGSIGCLYDIIIGQSLWFEYLQDNQGNDKTGYLKTSMVESFEEDWDLTIVETLNSMYYFRKII